AAEAITTAADPDANIIFGATINPELDGEVIITVVATGFDASYFSKRAIDSSSSAPKATPSFNSNATVTTSKQDEKALSEIDMNLDDNQAAEHDFTSEAPMPNIWSIHDDEDEDPDSKDKSSDDSDSDADDNDDDDSRHGEVVTGSSLEDELEKPSFLRRLSRRRKDDNEDSDAEPDDK
ncbi:MAG TPA: hypothetical protein VII55_01570, partial [Candidatus Saccharimonadales bacterium]